MGFMDAVLGQVSAVTNTTANMATAVTLTSQGQDPYFRPGTSWTDKNAIVPQTQYFVEVAKTPTGLFVIAGLAVAAFFLLRGR